MKSLSRVRPSATPWTAAHQAPPPMGFSRQEDWSGVQLPSPTYTTHIHKSHTYTHHAHYTHTSQTTHTKHTYTCVHTDTTHGTPFPNLPVGGSPCTACGQEEAQRGSHTVTHNLQETDCGAHGSRPRAGPDWPGWSHGQPLINHCIWKEPRQSEPHPRPEETRRSGIVPIKPCVCVCVCGIYVCMWSL